MRQMADRPIIFSGPMVRALLAGRKTQTRRIVKHAPHDAAKGEVFCDRDGDSPSGFTFVGQGGWPRMPIWPSQIPALPGDRLWVREAWQRENERPPFYRAEGVDWPGRWRSPTHMPRWASRLTLVVTDLRVQRLQDISEADAKAEGVAQYTAPEGNEVRVETYKQSFARLWNSLRGFGAWEDNPFVAALHFEVHRCNIDDME